MSLVDRSRFITYFEVLVIVSDALEFLLSVCRAFYISKICKVRNLLRTCEIF